MVEKFIDLNQHSPDDQRLSHFSQGYSSPTSLSTNRDNIPLSLCEHVSMQDYLDKGEEWGALGPVLVLAIFIKL